MSLFENNEYRWRETFFVLMKSSDRPLGEVLRNTLSNINRKYDLSESRTNDEAQFESITLYSPDDNAAMDITYLDGEDVMDQLEEMINDMKRNVTSDEEREIVTQLPKCNARLDIYHFEKLTFIGSDDEEEEFLDPGSLLIVLEELAGLCNGIAVDPQTGMSPL